MEENIPVINLSDDDDDDIQIQYPSSPSMLSTHSDNIYDDNNFRPGRVATPSTANTTEETRGPQKRQSESTTQNEQLPRRSSVPIIQQINQLTSIQIPSMSPQAGTSTSFNIYLFKKPTCSQARGDADPHSVLFEKGINSGQVRRPSAEPATISTPLNTGPSHASTPTAAITEPVVQAPNLPTTTTSCTPPPKNTPTRPIEFPSPPDSENEGSISEVRTSLAAQKRPSQTDSTLNRDEYSPPQKKRIAHVPPSSTRLSEKKTAPVSTTTTTAAAESLKTNNPKESETVDKQSDAKLKDNRNIDSAVSTSTVRLPEYLNVGFEAALNQYTAKYTNYIKERLKKNFDFNVEDDVANAIIKLNNVSKEMKPNKNCMREVFQFLEDLDPKNFDYEVARLARNQDKKKEMTERERFLHDLGEELRDLENQLVELDTLRSHSRRKKLTPKQEILWEDISTQLGKRFIAYKKEVGEGNEVLQDLHAEILRKIHLNDVTPYPQINEAVEKLIDERKDKYLHGKLKFEEMPYPISEDVYKKIEETSSLHSIGLKGEEMHKLNYEIFKFMASKVKDRRIRDLNDHLYVWTNYSKDRFKDELKNNPSYNDKNINLKKELTTNRITAQSNLNMAYDQLCACAKQEEEDDDDISESSEESDGDDDDEEEASDRNFIDNASEFGDDDCNDDDDGDSSPPFSPVASTSRGARTRSRSRMRQPSPEPEDSSANSNSSDNADSSEADSEEEEDEDI